MTSAATPSRFADLHLHTRYSDGTFTPRELVEHALKLGFTAIAVTDHDTLDAIPEALAAGQELGIEVIPGVEITSRIDTQELHMLAYLFGDSWRDPNLRMVLDHATRVRRERVDQFVAKLNELGVALTVEDVFACSDCGTVGRPHVAQALVKRGFVASVEEAFNRFLKRGKPAYVERYRMEAAETIGHIKRAGGVAVIAHPGLNYLDKRLHEMVDQGMSGIEVWHSRHTPAQVEHYEKMAETLGVCATGGSDCHGLGRDGMLLGRIKLPYERVEVLKARAPAKS
ncbi:MAG TPA: PHP domain-containing protein [Verrucomicrobiae bacterium]|nr:PHP domain-containing protein [Verrucomicrobiae bacterium]